MPNGNPKYMPEMKTVTDMNSTFGIKTKANPSPMEVPVKIEAFTILSSFISFQKGYSKIIKPRCKSAIFFFLIIDHIHNIHTGI